MPSTLLDLAYEVLKKADKPLTYQEVWQAGEQLYPSDERRSCGPG